MTVINVIGFYFKSVATIGTALLNTKAATAATSFAAANTQLGDRVILAAQVHGFTVTFIFGASFMFIAAVVLFFLINIGKESVAKTEGAGMH